MTPREESLSIGRAILAVVALVAMAVGACLALSWGAGMLAGTTVAPDGRVIVGVLSAATGVWLAARIDKTTR